MNRRSFLRGLITAGAALSVPVVVFKAIAPTVSYHWALNRMNAIYFERTKGTGKSPRQMTIGGDLYDLYVNNLKTLTRYVADDRNYDTRILYRTCRCEREGKGYWVRFDNGSVYTL
jgi:hypothetical protein